MKKTFFFILTVSGICLVSCNNCNELNKEIQRLELKNDSLIRYNENISTTLLDKLNEDLERDELANKTKYLFVALWYESSYSGITSQSKVYISNIERIEGLSEEVKYRKRDELERELIQRFPISLKEITKKEIFVFDTYVEASEKIQELVR